MLEKAYMTNYLHLQEVISEMLETDLISSEKANHTTLYRITPQGSQTLNYFRKEISPELRSEIDGYLSRHAYDMRNDSSVLADYRQSAAHEYTVRCAASENGSSLIELSLTVPSEAAAQTIAENWKKKSQEVYSEVMNLLQSED